MSFGIVAFICFCGLVVLGVLWLLWGGKIRSLFNSFDLYKNPNNMKECNYCGFLNPLESPYCDSCGGNDFHYFDRYA